MFYHVVRTVEVVNMIASANVFGLNQRGLKKSRFKGRFSSSFLRV